jgi:hypothetical protein
MLDVPRNEEAELFIISEIMLGQDALAKAQDEGLRDEHFFSQKNRALYATIRDMHERGESIDPLSVATVIDDLGKMGSYPMQKGEVFDFLSSMDSYTFGGGIRTHVKSLIEKFNRRKIITAAEQATREASNGEIVNALCIMTELTLDERGRELSIEELGNKFIDDCKRGVVGHLEWWCEEWTNKLGKLSNEIFMISAPRSTGKTALMLQWMNRNHTDGHVTPLASIEMEKAELLPRMIAHRGQVCTYTMKTRGYVTADEESKARKALMEIKDLCYDVREHGMSIEDIRIWALGKSCTIRSFVSSATSAIRYHALCLFCAILMRRVRLPGVPMLRTLLTSFFTCKVYPKMVYRLGISLYHMITTLMESMLLLSSRKIVRAFSP